MLLAVTQLTSTSEERMQNELLINASMPDTVKKYAQNAKAAGLSGVVCSPLEAALVKEACGADFMTVTPGIRFADGDVGDQVRNRESAALRRVPGHQRRKIRPGAAGEMRFLTRLRVRNVRKSFSAGLRRRYGSRPGGSG